MERMEAGACGCVRYVCEEGRCGCVRYVCEEGRCGCVRYVCEEGRCGCEACEECMEVWVCKVRV